MNPGRSRWKREGVSWESPGAWVTWAGHLLAAEPKEVARHSGFACKRKSLGLAQLCFFVVVVAFNKNRQALFGLRFTAGQCRRHRRAGDLPSWSAGSGARLQAADLLGEAASPRSSRRGCRHEPPRGPGHGPHPTPRPCTPPSGQGAR